MFGHDARSHINTVLPSLKRKLGDSHRSVRNVFFFSQSLSKITFKPPHPNTKKKVRDAAHRTWISLVPCLGTRNVLQLIDDNEILCDRNPQARESGLKIIMHLVLSKRDSRGLQSLDHQNILNMLIEPLLDSSNDDVQYAALDQAGQEIDEFLFFTRTY